MHARERVRLDLVGREHLAARCRAAAARSRCRGRGVAGRARGAIVRRYGHGFSFGGWSRSYFRVTRAGAVPLRHLGQDHAVAFPQVRSRSRRRPRSRGRRARSRASPSGRRGRPRTAASSPRSSRRPAGPCRARPGFARSRPWRPPDRSGRAPRGSAPSSAMSTATVPPCTPGSTRETWPLMRPLRVSTIADRPSARSRASDSGTWSTALSRSWPATRASSWPGFTHCPGCSDSDCTTPFCPACTVIEATRSRWKRAIDRSRSTSDLRSASCACSASGEHREPLLLAAVALGGLVAAIARAIDVHRRAQAVGLPGARRPSPAARPRAASVRAVATEPVAASRCVSSVAALRGELGLGELLLALGVERGELHVGIAHLQQDGARSRPARRAGPRSGRRGQRSAPRRCAGPRARACRCRAPRAPSRRASRVSMSSVARSTPGPAGLRLMSPSAARMTAAAIAT